jgi:DNA polymerase III delta subunit
MAKTATVSPVYALVGTDSFRQLQALHDILAAMPADVQRVDVEGERAELADVLDELRSFAMFGGTKLVVVREADAFITRFREQLEDYVANPSQSGTLVLRLNSLPANQRIYKAIAKTGKIEDCNPPKDAARWVADHGQSVHGIKLSPDAARLLVELVGNDLGRLDGELAKLALQTEDAGGKVDADAVTNSAAFQREQEMWDMTNELAAGNAAAALRRWRQLVQLDSSAEFRAVTWLGMWLEDVGAVVNSGNTSKLTWKYKNRLNQFMSAAKALGKAGHARALDLLAEIDHQSKSGVGDAASNVERFILTMGNAAA